MRLLPQLADFNVIGIDINSPNTSLPLHFVKMDLGQEQSCLDLTTLLKESRVATVIHLAFVLDPVRNGILDVDRMWQINVAGTARVMEAVTEANRLPYGLAAFAFTGSAHRAKLVGEQLEAGMVGVNTFAISVPESPFGGVKESGHGSEEGMEGLEACLVTKFISEA